jgi:hypothetical protein
MPADSSAGSLQRDAALAVPRRREYEHVQVVRGIRQEALAFRGLLIRLPRLETRAHRIAPSSDPRPDVRRHVVDMARARNGVAEVLGARDRTLRLRGQFGHVDVEMTGARMLDVALQRGFEHREQPGHGGIVDRKRAGTRQQQEQRLGVERGHVEIVWVCGGDLGHGVGVGPVRGAGPVSRTHRANQRLLLRVGAPIGECHGLPDGRGRAFGMGDGHAAVDVWSPRPGFAPITDRTLGIPLLRFAKRSTGLDLREGVHQLKALVEVRLRLGVR